MNKVTGAILFLALGLAVYWEVRSDIVLFDLLGIENHDPRVLTGPIHIFFKNHLADVFWCAAAYSIAGALRERKSPFPYSQFLLVLPLASEAGQAFGLVPGTFDWIDVAIYAVLLGVFLFVRRLQMKRLYEHLIGGFAVGVFALALVASSSPPPRPPPVYQSGTFTLSPRPDEIFAKPALAKILAVDKALAVVLRVPVSGEKVTADQQQVNGLLYNTIEKELAKSGYQVRDRALFSKVIDQGQLDYTKIGQLTDTDLIIELVRYQSEPYSATEYKDSSGVTKPAKPAIKFAGTAIEFKVVSVRENDFVGSYVFRTVPCTDGCTHKFSSTESSTWVFPAGTTADEAVFRDFATRLVRQLKPRR